MVATPAALKIGETFGLGADRTEFVLYWRVCRIEHGRGARCVENALRVEGVHRRVERKPRPCRAVNKLAMGV